MLARPVRLNLSHLRHSKLEFLSLDMLADIPRYIILPADAGRISLSSVCS